MWELRCSSSVVSPRSPPRRAAMAASRNQAAFSGVGARSSDWFWSWMGAEPVNSAFVVFHTLWSGLNAIACV